MKKLTNAIRNFFSDKAARRITILIIVLLLTLAGNLYYIMVSGKVSIEDSLLNAPIIAISPDQPGKIMETYVTEGQYVKKGDSLALVGTQTLKAYADGLIVLVDDKTGSIASAQTPVIQMINQSKIRVDGTIDENKGLSQINVGQPASFTVDALPGKTYWGYVDEISQTAKQAQAAFSISSTRPTQQFDVYVKFDSYSHPEIKNGMSAKITVFTK